VTPSASARSTRLDGAVFDDDLRRENIMGHAILVYLVDSERPRRAGQASFGSGALVVGALAGFFMARRPSCVMSAVTADAFTT
jgi:hypothetical protein